MTTKHLRVQVGGSVFLVPMAQRRIADRLRSWADNRDMLPLGAVHRAFKGQPGLSQPMSLAQAFKHAGFAEEAQP